MSENAEIGPGPDAVWLGQPEKAVAEIRRLEARVAELHDALVQMDLYCGCHGCSACAAMARALGAEASATAAEIIAQGGRNRG